MNSYSSPTQNRLTPSQQQIGRQYYLWFIRINAFSFICLAESILILYAIKNGANDFILGLLTSAFCLAILLYGLDLKRLCEALQMLEIGLLLPAMVLTILTFGLKSLRWRRLMSPCHRYSWCDAFNAYVIGHMGNYILPLRAGDFPRVLVITKSGGEARSAVLASVVTERILDVAALLLLGLISMLISPWSGWPPSILWFLVGLMHLDQDSNGAFLNQWVLWGLINMVLHFFIDGTTSRINAALYENHRHWFFVMIGFDQWIHYMSLIISYSIMIKPTLQ